MGEKSGRSHLARVGLTVIKAVLRTTQLGLTYRQVLVLKGEACTLPPEAWFQPQGSQRDPEPHLIWGSNILAK